MLRQTLIAGGLALALAACNRNGDSEDLTNDVNHSGSVESSIKITPLDSNRRLLTTHHTVWVKGGVYRTIIYTDTLPALGRESTVAENEDGDQQTVNVDKDYEIYITVQ